MKQTIFIITSIWFLSATTGCTTETPAKNEVSTMDVSINYMFDASNFELNKEYNLPSKEGVRFSRISYLLSNFYLIDENNFKITLNDQYLHADIGTSKTQLTLTNIPKGVYTGIGFSIGLDSNTNHGNPNIYATNHPLSPINNSLHWSWKGGYIFTAIEGKTLADNESFIFHLAGTMNRVDIELAHPFTKGDDALHAELIYDVKELFENPEVYNIKTDGSSTHNVSDTVTLKLFENMNDVFTISNIGNL